MNEVRECLTALGKDPRAKELLKGLRGSVNAESAAKQYAEIAEKLGFSLPEEKILAFLKEEQELVRSRTEKAAEQVEKTALSEEALEEVAGGDGGYVKDHPECDTTFSDNEWCWISDNCSLVITYYNEPKGNMRLTDPCDNNAYGDKMHEEIWTPDPDDNFEPTKGSGYFVWCYSADLT